MSSGGGPNRGGGCIMKSTAPTGSKKQSMPLEDALNILLQGYTKGKLYNPVIFEGWGGDIPGGGL